MPGRYHQAWHWLPLRLGLASVEGAEALSLCYRGQGLVRCPLDRGEQGGRGCNTLLVPGVRGCLEGPEVAVGGKLLDLTWLCDPGQATTPSWASVAAFVKWG